MIRLFLFVMGCFGGYAWRKLEEKYEKASPTPDSPQIPPRPEPNAMTMDEYMKRKKVKNEKVS